MLEFKVELHVSIDMDSLTQWLEISLLLLPTFRTPAGGLA